MHYGYFIDLPLFVFPDSPIVFACPANETSVRLHTIIALSCQSIYSNQKMITMKTLLLTGVALLFFAGTSFSQSKQSLKKDIRRIDHREAVLKDMKRKDKITLRKLEGKEASYQSTQQFKMDFGNATNVNWTRDGFFDKATFTQNGKTMEAYYNFDAQLVGTVTPSTFSALPANAQKDIQKHYKDYKVMKVIYYDDNEANSNDMLLYGAQFEDEDSYFVELSKNNKKIVLHVVPDGGVFYFTEIK